MKIRKLLILLLVSCSLFASYVAVAGPDEDLEACLSKQENYSTAGMANCTNEGSVNWDKELNQIYKKLMSKLTPEGKESLKQSQRQWIKFRDNEYQFIADMYDRREFSGTMYIPMRSMDVMQVTKKRTLELIKYLKKHK